MEIGHSEGRFFVKTEHGEAELLYRIQGKEIDMYHTFTPPEDRGKGIAAELVEAALEFAKRNNLEVIPTCPYVRHYVEMHKAKI